ncbi:MAG: GtrA family protein [Actinobacteria bacterium]|nr:GtrA family protein [Actinomycetota bacterium]
MDHTRTNNLQARLRRAVGQFWKYCLVGASGFIVNFLVFSILVSRFEVHYLLAGTVSFAVAVTNNFLLNRYWTFGSSERDIRSQATRFLIISATSLALNMMLLRLFVEDGNLDQYVAQAIAIGMVTVLNFTGNKLWSFRQPTAR